MSDVYQYVDVNVSWLQSRTYCYVRVIRVMCTPSAADVNVLKTILYNAKYSYIVNSSCTLGEAQRI